MKRVDIAIGQMFGRWTVQSIAESSEQGNAMLNCLCACGASANVNSHSLRAGTSRSCGCLQREVAGAMARTHGQSRTRTHYAWVNMKSRCNNPNTPGYKNYGGRGIKVCKHWATFDNFLADMGECPPGLTLERKNNAKNYMPSNCCWATRTEQARNTRASLTGMYRGKRWCVAELALAHGVKTSTAYSRIYRGWAFADACTTRSTT
jgi:hypothetical protein